jgi:hypothetical protein
MGNMAYCRFENTVEDMQDCYDHFFDDDLSPPEEMARNRMIKICKEIISDLGEEE